MDVLPPRDPRQVAGELKQTRESRRAHEVLEVDLVAELVRLYDTVPESLVAGAERLVASGHDGTPVPRGPTCACESDQGPPPSATTPGLAPIM